MQRGIEGAGLDAERVFAVALPAGACAAAGPARSPCPRSLLEQRAQRGAGRVERVGHIIHRPADLARLLQQRLGQVDLHLDVRRRHLRGAGRRAGGRVHEQVGQTPARCQCR